VKRFEKTSKAEQKEQAKKQRMVERIDQKQRLKDAKTRANG
jgi:hypothetical protein